MLPIRCVPSVPHEAVKIKARRVLLVSRDRPAGLMPEVVVVSKPGGSKVVKVPSLARRKP
jgi:hypothetical protein